MNFFGDIAVFKDTSNPRGDCLPTLAHPAASFSVLRSWALLQIHGDYAAGTVVIGPHDLHVVKELHATRFSRKHPVIPVYLVAGVFVECGSVDHYDYFRKVLEDRRKTVNGKWNLNCNTTRPLTPNQTLNQVQNVKEQYD